MIPEGLIPSPDNSENSQNFYKPITDRQQTIGKLKELSQKPSVTDNELFEVIADTYGVLAGERVTKHAFDKLNKSGVKVRGIDLEFVDWEKILQNFPLMGGVNESEIEMESNSFGKVTIGYNLWTRRYDRIRLEVIWIVMGESYLGGASYIEFYREQDGSIKPIDSIYYEEDGTKKGMDHEVSEETRRNIVLSLFEGISPKDSTRET